jgi:hypothetical protein
MACCDELETPPNAILICAVTGPRVAEDMAWLRPLRGTRLWQPTGEVPLTQHPLINVGLLVVLVVCLFESYYGWGWGVVGTGATVALTRPWLPSKTEV